MSVKITVAIATRDRPRELMRCLDAVLGGRTAPAEVIVVDQSDGEESRLMLEAQGEGDERFVYIRQRARGLSASRNLALARARQPVLAVTDDDCVPDDRWLESMAAAFAAAEAPDAVTGPVLPFGPEAPDMFAVSSRTSVERRLYEGSVPPWLVGTGGNFAVVKARLDALGGYDERLGAGSRGGAGEDMDVLRRLLRAGGRVLYEPGAVVYHQRQSRAARRASRGSYGLGIGACCALWLREGDKGSLGVLARWTGMRGRLLARAILRGDLREAADELRVVRGTARGLMYGLTAPARRGTTTL